MKIELRGWARETTVHEHVVTPIVLKGKKYFVSEGTTVMSWNPDYSTYGKIDKVALTGSFMVQLKFEEKDLEAWLAKFVQTEPERAAKLLSKMHTQALINFTREVVQAALPTEA